MAELTQEEINSLSPRARKALGQNDMLQEIVEVNPNAEPEEVEQEEVEPEEVEQEEEE